MQKDYEELVAGQKDDGCEDRNGLGECFMHSR